MKRVVTDVSDVMGSKVNSEALNHMLTASSEQELQQNMMVHVVHEDQSQWPVDWQPDGPISFLRVGGIKGNIKGSFWGNETWFSGD